MNHNARAYGIGALSGSRSMLGPAMVARRALSPTGRRLLALLALGEMVADKSAHIPARINALPLTGRLVTGALAAAAAGGRRRRLRGALLGAAGALSAAYACYHLRRLAHSRFGVPNVIAGVAEDALALGAGALLLGSSRGAPDQA